jgi:hypothetical protein
MDVGAYLIFEIADLTTEGRLRRVQLFLGRDRQASGLGNRDEVAKVPELHRCLPYLQSMAHLTDEPALRQLTRHEQIEHGANRSGRRDLNGALSERKSGYEFMGPDTRTMQDDDAANPGMLWVLDGEALWNRREDAAGKSCADCHGDARSGMRGVAAHYPGFETGRAAPVNLEQRINICRAERQKATPFRFESKDLLALAAYLGYSTNRASWLTSFARAPLGINHLPDWA